MAKRKRAARRKAAPRAVFSGRTLADNKSSRNTLLALIVIFTLLAFLIQASIVAGAAVYWLLVICAVGFFLIEAYYRRDEPLMIGKAVFIGFFLAVFDFAFQNAGWLLGLWQTSGSILMMGAVPIEIVLICFIGGTAWALYIPKKYNRFYTVMDVLVFAAYGALGEYLLIFAGLMSYHAWWNSWWAFAAYACVWLVLHFVRYKVVKV